MPMAAANYHNTPKKSLILRDNEFMGDLAAWERANAGDNDEQLDRLRRNLQKVRELELTEKQAEAVHLYYDLGLSIPQIAQERGVHKSTVSRTLAVPLTIRSRALPSHTSVPWENPESRTRVLKFSGWVSISI